MTIQTINPTTGESIKKYPIMDLHDIDKIIDLTHKDFLHWRETNIEERTKKIQKIGEILLDQKQEFANLITQEMGKPIKLATAEIEKCAKLCQHITEHAEQYLKSRVVQTEMRKSYISYQPLGVIFAIMPWNFPFWQVFRALGPTITAGNAAVLKHAPTTTGCGLAIEKIFRLAGFPENLFRVLIIETELAEKVIQHQKIAGVTLTGSVRAGKKVGAESVSHLKKVVLELGGSDPYLILEDADLEKAAEQCVTSRLSNSGQVCIAAKRLIVVDAIRDRFEQKVIEKAKHYQIGDPRKESTQLGPLARADLRETVNQQVQTSIAKGAELVMGGSPIVGPGFFYPVTVLKNIKPGMPAYDEEIFGPVIAFISAKNEQDAIQIANSSSFGLGAAVFTENLARGEKVAQQLEAGTCCVNVLVATDPRLPFGGIKSSGFGRELDTEGMREFTNVKTICIK